MDWFGLLIIVLISGGLSVGGGWMFAHNLRRARYLLNTPTSKIRSAAQGYVELSGVVDPHASTILSPLSHTPCVWWNYRIEEHRRRGTQKSDWQLVEQKTSDQPIPLTDGTGTCWIDPSGAQVTALCLQRWTGNLRHPLRPEQRGWLRTFLTGQKKYRYIEYRLDPHAPLYAIGHFYSRGGGHDTLRLEDRQANLIREWKTDYPSLVKRFDRNRDGQLDPQEWQNVRAAALHAAATQQRQDSTAPAQHYLRRPDNGQPFILSARGQEHQIRHFRWQAALGAALCIAGVLIGAHFLNGQL